MAKQLPTARKPRPIRTEACVQVLMSEDARHLPILPPRKAGDVGFDLHVVHETVVPPGAFLPLTDLPCGVRIKLPEGTWGLLMFRSGTYAKYPSLYLCQAPLDAGYTGPIDPRVRNLGNDPVLIPCGERLAQLVILSAVVPRIVLVDELPETERGASGFGSTGR